MARTTPAGSEWVRLEDAQVTSQIQELLAAEGAVRATTTAEYGLLESILSELKQIKQQLVYITDNEPDVPDEEL